MECCKHCTFMMFQFPGVHLVQIYYSEMTVAGLPCESCQLCAGDSGDGKVKRKPRQGHCSQALTLGRQDRGSLFLEHHRLLNSRVDP